MVFSNAKFGIYIKTPLHNDVCELSSFLGIFYNFFILDFFYVFKVINLCFAMLELFFLY